jgi:hypothetical protein
MVNYYEVGDLFTDVDILNGFAPAPDGGTDGFPPDAWPEDSGLADASDPASDVRAE